MGFASCAFVVPLGFVVAELDPMRYNLDYVLPEQIYRSRVHLFSSFIVRLAITELAFVEIFRTASFQLLLFFMIISRVNSIDTIILTWQPKPAIFYQLYKAIYIIFQDFGPIIEFGVEIVLTLYFILVVSLSWILIKLQASVMGYMMYSWCLTLLIGLIVFGASIIYSACRILDTSKELLSSFKMKSKLEFKKSPSIGTRCDKLNLFGMLEIRLKYSLIGYLGMPFFMNFYFMLTLRIFDAILVVSK